MEKLNSIALEGQTPPITDPTMVQHPIPLTEHQCKDNKFNNIYLSFRVYC